jgi:hypothetical protein
VPSRARHVRFAHRRGGALRVQSANGSLERPALAERAIVGEKTGGKPGTGTCEKNSKMGHPAPANLLKQRHGEVLKLIFFTRSRPDVSAFKEERPVPLFFPFSPQGNSPHAASATTAGTILLDTQTSRSV